MTDWVELGTPTLHDARRALGLSYEAMGRKLSVAAKTWERWEKAGRVPRYELRRVAELLDLEIDWPQKPDAITVSPESDDRLDRLEAQLGSALGLLQELRTELVAQRGQQEAPPAVRSRRS